MIRILADATFPKSLESHGTTRLHFEVLALQDARTDVELALLAAEEKFQGLALLGRDVFAQRDLVEMTKEVGLCLIATHTDDPVEAVEHFGEHAKTLFESIGPGKTLLVLSHEVRVIDLAAPSGVADFEFP